VVIGAAHRPCPALPGVRGRNESIHDSPITNHALGNQALRARSSWSAGAMQRSRENNTLNVLPRPGSLATSRRAWCRFTTCLTMASPSPVPPVSRERLLCSLKNCLTYHALIQKVGRLEQTGHGRLLGEAGCINAMKRQLEKIAPTQGRILILGESGTGKELVADWIHRHSPRAARPFVKINTAALPPNLIEDELFGHVRGAFTGAHDEKLGLFEQAHGGTLFLDEIGDMYARPQVRLLRVLEEGVVRRVGGSRDIAVDVRIICATHRDLQEACRRHLFREDLYFRLSTFPIRVPPLRKRGGDIALLAAHFIATFCDRESLPRKKVDAAVWEVLRRYPWPGNVRELRNVCERLAVLGGNPIRLADLPSDLSGDVREVGHLTETGLVRLTTTHTGFTLKTFKHQCEKEFLESALRRHNWDYVAAARSLDIQRTYLHRKIAKLGILKP